MTEDERTELEELRAYQRRMVFIWNFLNDVRESIDGDLSVTLGPENDIVIACCTCVRVVGILDACLALESATNVEFRELSRESPRSGDQGASSS